MYARTMIYLLSRSNNVLDRRNAMIRKIPYKFQYLQRTVLRNFQSLPQRVPSVTSEPQLTHEDGVYSMK